jgi:hypothetical protein
MVDTFFLIVTHSLLVLVAIRATILDKKSSKEFDTSKSGDIPNKNSDEIRGSENA